MLYFRFLVSIRQILTLVIVFTLASIGGTGVASAQTEPAGNRQSLLHFYHQKPSAFVQALTATKASPKAFLHTIHYSSRLPNPVFKPILDWPVTFLRAISLLIPDDTEGTLIVSGTNEAVIRVEELHRLFDVSTEPVTLCLHLRKRVNRNTDNTILIASTQLEAENNSENQITLVADGRPFSFAVTPHRNGDGSLLAAVDVRTEDFPESETETDKSKGRKQLYSHSTLFLSSKQPATTKVIQIPFNGIGFETDSDSYLLEIVSTNRSHPMDFTPGITFLQEAIYPVSTLAWYGAL